MDLGCHSLVSDLSALCAGGLLLCFHLLIAGTLAAVFLLACTPAADGLGVALVALGAGHGHVLVLRWTQPLCCPPHCRRFVFVNYFMLPPQASSCAPLDYAGFCSCSSLCRWFHPVGVF
jgi:hypothetical protein